MRYPFLAALSCGVLALGIAACGGDDSSGSSGGSGGGDLSGAIAVDGSSTVFPFAQAAAEGFQGENSGVKVTVGESGTGGGFEKFCAGETDISDASRPIDAEEEVPVCKKGGVTYTHVQVANDGIAVVSNPSLKIDCLTTDQLKALWKKGSSVTNYSAARRRHPRRQGLALRTGHRLRHVRLLHGGDQRREGRHAHRLPAVRGRQRARPGRRGRQDGDRLLRLLLLRGQPGQAQPDRGRRRRRLRQAVQGDDPERHVQAARRVRCSCTRATSRSSSKPQVKGFMDYTVDNAVEIADTANIVPLTDEQLTKAKAAIARLLGPGASSDRWMRPPQLPARRRRVPNRCSASPSGATARR